jgi:hypothetical protein
VNKSNDIAVEYPILPGELKFCWAPLLMLALITGLWSSGCGEPSAITQSIFSECKFRGSKNKAASPHVYYRSKTFNLKKKKN